MRYVGTFHELCGSESIRLQREPLASLLELLKFLRRSCGILLHDLDGFGRKYSEKAFVPLPVGDCQSNQ